MNLKEFCEKYNYTLRDKLPEGWDRYKNWIPSVTTILSLLEDKWFETVLRVNSSAVKSSIQEWLKTHKEADEFFKPKSLTKDVNLNVIKFHSYYDVKIISTEETFYKDISGQVDLICNIDGIIYNVDYKYSKYQSPKYFLQLMGYKYLNGNDWILAYLKWTLKIIHVDNFYYDVFIELKDYFLSLLEDAKGENHSGLPT